MRKPLALILGLAVGVALGTLGAQALGAQQPIERTVLVKSESLKGIPGMDGYVMEVTIAPGAQSGRHVHPGHEFSYVLDGEGMLEVDGRPPLALKKGVTFHNEPMVVHNGINSSMTTPLHVLVFYVLETGKPIATPVK